MELGRSGRRASRLLTNIASTASPPPLSETLHEPLLWAVVEPLPAPLPGPAAKASRSNGRGGLRVVSWMMGGRERLDDGEQADENLDMALPAIVGGKYRVLRELARGGMGVVYAVEHQGTGEELALKVMSDRLLASPQALERFKREARAPTRIKSEHVVRMIDADTAPELGGAPFLVMELLDGDDLDKLSQREPPSPASIVDWMRQASRALDRAHSLGFVHRDLKPANLFLARRSEGPPIVKVLDFGIVKLLEDTGATESGATLGTPRYMAPEQVLAERGKVGPAADIWAMGMVAFRLLSGQEYWAAETTVSLIGQILHGKMPKASERGCHLGEAFDAWFARSCDRDPELRYRTVGEQVDALAAAVEGVVSSPRMTASDPNEMAHASTAELPHSASSEPRRSVAPTPAVPSETIRATIADTLARRPRSRFGYLLAVVAVSAATSLTWWVVRDRSVHPAQAGDATSAVAGSRPPRRDDGPLADADSPKPSTSTEPSFPASTAPSAAISPATPVATPISRRAPLPLGRPASSRPPSSHSSSPRDPLADPL